MIDALQLLVFGLTAGAVIALSAAGFTLTFAVTRQVNLAHGNVFALTTVAVASLARALGVTAATPLPGRLGALLLLAVVGALIGALLSGLVERLAFRPFDGRREPLGPLIASLALSFLMLGAAVRWHSLTNVPMPGHQGVNLPMLAMPDLVPFVELGCCGISLTLKDLLVLLVGGLVAVGGYTLAMLTAGSSRLAPLVPAVLHEPWLALPIAGLVAAGFGILFGLPSIRARGEYLAIVTLALGEIVPALVIRFPDLTSGARGISGISPPAMPGLPSGSPLHAYILALALAACVWISASRLAASRLGRAWAAVRDDELAARSLGVDSTAVKLLAFAFGAGVAGLAGALFAGLVGHIVPEQFDLTLSLMVLSAVAIGGRWGLLGVVGGALLVALYDRVLVDAVSAGLRALGSLIGWPLLRATDLRGDNFLVFGLLLYLATLLPGRSLVRPPARPQLPALALARPRSSP